MKAVDDLLGELHRALEQAGVSERHLRVRAVARITRAYEAYWKACGALDDSNYEEHTAAAARAVPPSSNDTEKNHG